MTKSRWYHFQSLLLIKHVQVENYSVWWDIQPSWRLRLGYDSVFYVRSRVKSNVGIFKCNSRFWMLAPKHVWRKKLYFKGVWWLFKFVAKLSILLFELVFWRFRNDPLIVKKKNFKPSCHILLTSTQWQQTQCKWDVAIQL